MARDAKVLWVDASYSKRRGKASRGAFGNFAATAIGETNKGETMAHPIYARVRGILTSGTNYGTGLTRVIPDMLDHLAAHRDTTVVATLLNGLENIAKKDAARVAAIIKAVVVEGLTISANKDTRVWKATIRAESKGGLVLSDNALTVLRSLGDEGVKVHSPRIDDALFNESKEPAAFDIDKRIAALVKKARDEGFDDNAILSHILAKLTMGQAVKEKSDAPTKGDDVEDAVVVTESTAVAVAA